jgi:hypothetical protein
MNFGQLTLFLTISAVAVFTTSFKWNTYRKTFFGDISMTSETEVENVLRRCYEAFNARNLKRALALLHPDVMWPNAWEGGWLKGRDAVREYWQRQWAAIDPRVEPRAFSWDVDGYVIVTVHQVVRDVTGKVLADEMVEHIYEMQDGLVVRMEIRK